MRVLRVLISAALVVTGCDQIQSSQKSSPAASLPPSSTHEVATVTQSQEGLSDFEIRQDKTGRMIRLNRRTGEMAVLQGNSLVPIETPEEREKRLNWDAELWKAREWPQLTLTGDWKQTTLRMVTSWREGKIYYRLVVSGSAAMAASVSANPSGFLNLLLSDSDGFVVVRILVPLRKLTRILDDASKVSSYEVNDSTECSEDAYVGAANWRVEWGL